MMLLLHVCMSAVARCYERPIKHEAGQFHDAAMILPATRWLRGGCGSCPDTRPRRRRRTIPTIWSNRSTNLVPSKSRVLRAMARGPQSFLVLRTVAG